MGARPFTVVIIGGGFSGAVAAIKLLDIAAARPLRIRIVEPRPELGRGLAFSTPDPAHYLNAPARLFSIHADRPDHLAHWLSVQEEAADIPLPASGQLADAFVPRQLYGAYVRAELARAEAEAGLNGSVEHLRAEAIDLVELEQGVRVTLSDGRIIGGDVALLATGFAGNRPTFEVAATPGSRYLADPWSLTGRDLAGAPPEAGPASVAADLPRDGTVVFVGGGLTMLDALVTLERKGFSGRYVSVSRHGLLVHERREPTPARDFLGETHPGSARALLRLARAELRAIAAAGGDWQSVVPVIRARLASLWNGASPAERARFNRHLRRYWELALHRAPGPSHETFARVRAAGRIATRAGRIEDITADAQGAIVRLKPRGGTAHEEIRADLVVNCTGAEYAWPRQSGRPLATNLLARGTVRPGGLGYGIDIDAAAAVIAASGHVSNAIFGIGPILRGTRWEATTIAEIVGHATAFAEHLATTRLSRRPPAVPPAASSRASAA
ncbi:FAD/NAD(P)-binding protein [Xanthobacter autotrophicus DSM 431]|uniref:FAD/NAD(P)-binding protein n=1 Tax=Xanthobacter nonsaccharivorans TaxID=3119912 RepID=UPI00372A315F